MRRWRVVVIDDNPEGSLEAVLLSPLVVAQPLGSDASEEKKAAAIRKNLLNAYLPLAEGELYANEADIDFQIRNFSERRAACHPRHPMVELERDFVRAWKLVGELAEDPPDIVFLDVMFELKASASRDIETIIDEIQRSDRIGQQGRPTVLEILSRGGLFLLGRLLRGRDVRQLPLIVLYSASRDVQNDFRPFEYASDGRFEVVAKNLLRTDAELRKKVFRRRIRDYFVDGTIRPDKVRAAVTLLGSSRAIEGHHETLVQAFSQQIGSGWCFGSMFAAESVAYLSNPSRRQAAIEELENFIAPLVSDARSFVDLMEFSPARLFSHRSSDVITFSRRPTWLDPSIGDEIPGKGKVRVSLSMLNGDLSDVQNALQGAVRRLPVSLRNALTAGLAKQLTRATAPDIEPKRRRVQSLDSFVFELSGYDPRWEKLIDQCRMRMPAAKISELLEKEAGLRKPLHLRHAAAETSSGAWDLGVGLELVLAPSESEVKEPLATLLRSVVGSIHQYACRRGREFINVTFTTRKEPTALQVVIHDNGPGFADLRYYNPHVRPGNLSTAIAAAAEWFEVEIHSGGVRCRPAAQRTAVVERSSVTEGTAFVIRIPAFRMEA